MFINNREWEIQILSGIERLVHILIEASYAKGLKKEDLLNNAVLHLRNLNPLLLKLVDEKEEHLESLIRQLFSQKLPPGFILTSFGGLRRDLDFVILQALIPVEPEPITEQPAQADIELIPEPDPQVDKFIENTNQYEQHISDKDPEPEISKVRDLPVEDETILLDLCPGKNQLQNQALKSSSPTLADIIANFYPNDEVISNYTIRSVSIDYYLPKRKIAYVFMSPGKRIYKMHRLLLKQEGITLIEVAPGELNNIRLLARHLPKF